MFLSVTLTLFPGKKCRSHISKTLCTWRFTKDHRHRDKPSIIFTPLSVTFQHALPPVIKLNTHVFWLGLHISRNGSNKDHEITSSLPSFGKSRCIVLFLFFLYCWSRKQLYISEKRYEITKIIFYRYEKSGCVSILFFFFFFLLTCLTVHRIGCIRYCRGERIERTAMDFTASQMAEY